MGLEAAGASGALAAGWAVLVMGLFSPYWMRSIDTYATYTANQPAHFIPFPLKHIETETYSYWVPDCSHHNCEMRATAIISKEAR